MVEPPSLKRLQGRRLPARPAAVTAKNPINLDVKRVWAGGGGLPPPPPEPKLKAVALPVPAARWAIRAAFRQPSTR